MSRSDSPWFVVRAGLLYLEFPLDFRRRKWPHDDLRDAAFHLGAHLEGAGPGKAVDSPRVWDHVGAELRKPDGQEWSRDTAEAALETVRPLLAEAIPPDEEVLLERLSKLAAKYDRPGRRGRHQVPAAVWDMHCNPPIEWMGPLGTLRNYEAGSSLLSEAWAMHRADDERTTARGLSHYLRPDPWLGSGKAGP